MTTPGRGGGRWLRAGVLTLLTVLISIGGHAAAGGSVSLSLPLLIGGTALAAACVAAADVRRSFVEIFAVVLLAQPVLHLLASMGAHGHAGGHSGGAGFTSTSMVAAHALAALLVSALLAGAERGFWTVAALFSPRRVPTATPVCGCAPPRLVPRARASTPVRPAPLVAHRRPRGPPVTASTV